MYVFYSIHTHSLELIHPPPFLDSRGDALIGKCLRRPENMKCLFCNSPALPFLSLPIKRTLCCMRLKLKPSLSTAITGIISIDQGSSLCGLGLSPGLLFHPGFIIRNLTINKQVKPRKSVLPSSLHEIPVVFAFGPSLS